MQGECTSPVTTPLASISTRPFAKITPSKRPEITTRLPSICPSTLAPSPSTTVCSEIMLPFTLPLMRNVPVTVNVPSRVTPWSMKPVHSSLPPPLALVELGHFHAMMSILQTDSSHFSGSTAQVNAGFAEKCRIRRRWKARLLHEAIINAHQLRVFVVLQHKLAGATAGFLTEKHFRAEVPL